MSNSIRVFAPASVANVAVGFDILGFALDKPGDEIKGTIELTGTVDIPNFGFYKYEVAPNGSDTWATIAAGREVVKDASLGRWDTTALTPGDYQLRLVLVDNQGTVLPPCVVPVQVVPNE